MGSAKEDKASINQKSQKNVCKENGVGNKLAKILDIGRDPKKLESMTVQELRAALRNVGASSKGRKEELVSALKAVLDGGTDGKSPLICKKQCSDDQRVNENSSAIPEEKGACIQESVQGPVVASEASKCLRSKRKENYVDDGNVEVCTDVKKVKQSTSVETDDLSAISSNSSAMLITKKMNVYRHFQSLALSIAAGNKWSVKRKTAVEIVNVKVSQGLDESSPENEPWTRFAHMKPQKAGSLIIQRP